MRELRCVLCSISLWPRGDRPGGPDTTAAKADDGEIHPCPPSQFVAGESVRLEPTDAPAMSDSEDGECQPIQRREIAVSDHSEANSPKLELEVLKQMEDVESLKPMHLQCEHKWQKGLYDSHEKNRLLKFRVEAISR